MSEYVETEDFTLYLLLYWAGQDNVPRNLQTQAEAAFRLAMAAGDVPTEAFYAVLEAGGYERVPGLDLPAVQSRRVRRVPA